MNDLLADFLNDRLAPVPMGGTVNGMIDYNLGELDNEEANFESEEDTDTECLEYANRELNSYYPEPQTLGRMSDIIDGHEESILGTELCELAIVPKVFNMYKFDVYYKKQLPIDEFREKILALINTNSVVIIHGVTGCGKTTQVPQFILDQCKATKSPCNIIVTQPRRIAAINIAQRVCEERGWAIGTVCGYQVGLDKNVGEDVVLTYVTTEVLLQKLIVQKNLNRYTHIIIDEVHERSKTLDFLLLVVRKYLYTNSPSVKIILMSATMEAKEFAFYFRNFTRNNPKQYLLAPILHVNKKSEFTTSVYYNEQFASAPIEYSIDDPCITQAQYELCYKLIQIFDNLDETDLRTNEKIVGSVLVFLPGFHEIEEMSKLLRSKIPEFSRMSTLTWEIIPLHSSLSSDHMVKVFQRPKQGMRKIILSTNIAESSVTVPDVTYVIDFCLTKNMTVNKITKFSTLSLQWASHNNCIQRAGRVGRVSNGRIYRLVPQQFYMTQMQDNILPELQRAPLENIILYMKLLDLNDTPKNVLSLAISPPNLKDVESCIWHLKEVGALLTTCRGNYSTADGDITFLGKIMGSLPLDIHLSKLIILGHMFSCLDETIIMAAGCTTRNLFVNKFDDRCRCYRKKLLWADGSCSDFITLLNLYNVWWKRKREHAFRNANEEYMWCKKNFVNLKGLREWDILIKEITGRLKKFNIEKAMGVARVQLSPIEKATVLKVIISGAFYPHYFVRSGEFGQVDTKEAVKILNGRDLFNTVYFTNMKLHQPGHIYVRQIKKLMEAENNPNVHIGFDQQSSRIFIEYKNIKQPEQITVDGQQYITTISGNISMDVYEAVRKRQLNIYFPLKILPDFEAWEFAQLTEQKKKLEKIDFEDVNCFTTVKYSSLPPLDIEYMSVIVTHIIDASHFYCQQQDDESITFLNRIFAHLNGPGVILEPLTLDEKVDVGTTFYAAKYNEDGKFYRCKVLRITPGKPPQAQVIFIDYGNTQGVPVNRLYHLPDYSECKICPIAICCALSEIQPYPNLNSPTLWSNKVTNLFRHHTEKFLLNAKIYSVVDGVVHLELYRYNGQGLSFNQWLINEGHGQKCEESYLSKADHEIRMQVLNSDNPNRAHQHYKATSMNSYTDFEEPELRNSDIITLKGPYSPLEMQVYGLVQACIGSSIHIDGDSVNAVLLDDNPDDPHSRLLVAGQVAQSATAKTIKLSQTTIMPNIPGLPMLMTLLFCPQMEPKLTSDGARVASILCGLGYKEINDRPHYSMHDISLVLDTELNNEIIVKINELRYTMNKSIKIMNNIFDEIAYPEELFSAQKRLKEQLFDLLHIKQKSIERVHVKYAEVWNKNLGGDCEVLKMDIQNEKDDIWPLLWFVKLNKNKPENIVFSKNLADLEQIAKRLVDHQTIVCELCQSEELKTVADVRIHMFRDAHKKKVAQYKMNN